MKTLFLVLILALSVSCSAHEKGAFPDRSDVKLLPSVIEYILPSSYKVGVEYDFDDRLVKYGNGQIEYMSSTEITYEGYTYVTAGSSVYRDGVLLYDIDSRGYPLVRHSLNEYKTAFAYFKNGNLEIYTYHPWNDERVVSEPFTYDDKNSPLRYINSPKWLLYTIFGYDLGFNSNPAFHYWSDEDNDAGFEYVTEYNEFDYPVSVDVKPFGLLGANSRSFMFEY